MTVTIETADYARELADAIEEGLQGDGTHIGITDSEFIVKALRRLFAEAPGGVQELPEVAYGRLDLPRWLRGLLRR